MRIKSYFYVLFLFLKFSFNRPFYTRDHVFNVNLTSSVKSSFISHFIESFQRGVIPDFYDIHDEI